MFLHAHQVRFLYEGWGRAVGQLTTAGRIERIAGEIGTVGMRYLCPDARRIKKVPFLVHGEHECGPSLTLISV